MKSGSPKRVSLSLRNDEVSWLDQLLAVLRRGGEPGILMRQPQATMMAKKVERMKSTLRERGER